MTGHVTLVAQYVTDVFYIFNSTVVDWTCLFFFFRMFWCPKAQIL